jgi:beta-glucosidase
LSYKLKFFKVCGYLVEVRIVVMNSKVKELLSRMSVEEKVAQLMSIPIEKLLDGEMFSEEKAMQFLRYDIGEIARVGGSRIGLLPKEAAKVANQVQRFLVEKTRGLVYLRLSMKNV